MSHVKYHILDTEVQNHKHHGRFSSPWCPDNWIIAYGWKNAGDSQCSWQYRKDDTAPVDWEIPDDAEVLVGHNLRFDLCWIWKHPSFKKFIERGGKIWCTQYAEYLLEGQDPDFQMCSLEDTACRYGGTKKIDAVKAMWEAGHKTSEIPEDILIDYLVGTKDEGRNGGDIGNTELVFKAQYARALKAGMVPIIDARMDGYLATTEMEFNGVHVDVHTAIQDWDKLRKELADTEAKLNKRLPRLPPKVKFNWGSGPQVSAFLFGGYVKYEWSDNFIDPDTGELARSKVDVHCLYVGDKKIPVDECTPEQILTATRIKSGVHKGKLRTCKVKYPRGELKRKKFTEIVRFDRKITPLQEWETSRTDAMGSPLYSTGASVLEVLDEIEGGAVGLFATYKRLNKIIGTYYMAESSAGERTGMLTCVLDGTIHHQINHCSTVTGRTSASNPNLQQVPTTDKGPVKRMFCSRYAEGKVIEVDYSQLEVVVQGYLTGDKNLIRDLDAGVDFHVKRVSFKHGLEYSTALVTKCKDDTHPDFPFWSKERRSAKVYSFQSQYGAGAAKIALSSGMDIEEVKRIMAQEEIEYPLVKEYNDALMEHLDTTYEPYTVHYPNGGHIILRKGYWKVPTGTVFSFRSEPAPAWLKKKGIDQSFKPTQTKNYPTQGTGGEIMQVALGVLFRRMVAKGWWSNAGVDCPLLTNTVHDCVWADSPRKYARAAVALIEQTLSSVREIYMDKFSIDTRVDFPVSSEMGDNMAELHHIEKEDENGTTRQ